jgi:hypothetical protein
MAYLKAGDHMLFSLSVGAKKILLPMNPESVTVATGSSMNTFEVLDLGEVSLPRGTQLDRIMWDGILPGESRKNASYVRNWQDPKNIVKDIETWKNNGTKVRLLVTETPINQDVYISEFKHIWRGGHGDCQYEISLVQARDLVVRVQPGQAPKPKPPPRPSPPPPKTYTVKKGDTLWGIAVKFLKNGARWPEIYNIPANKKVIGPNPNLIYPGQVLQIP